MLCEGYFSDLQMKMNFEQSKSEMQMQMLNMQSGNLIFCIKYESKNCRNLQVNSKDKFQNVKDTN
jgi:hypothetical protein